MYQNALRRRLSFAFAFGVTGCVAQDITVQAPVVNAHPVTISVLPELEATEEAQALGWSAGIPRVAVAISFRDSAKTRVDSGTTDASGQVTLGPLAPGAYVISLLRVLDDEERAQLPSGSSLEGFALEADINVTASEALSATALRATRGSLVTSEWFNSAGYYGEYGYSTGVFWELYNNSDSAIKLDGLILGLGRSQYIETQPFSCAQSDSEFLEPDGVWANRLDRIEGAGNAHLVQPGQVIVVAGYAIDHSALFQNALDLRNSDFEFGSASGATTLTFPIWPGSAPTDSQRERFSRQRSVFP